MNDIFKICLLVLDYVVLIPVSLVWLAKYIWKVQATTTLLLPQGWEATMYSFIFKFAPLLFSPPLPSVVQVSKQIKHWTFDPINTLTLVVYRGEIGPEMWSA